LPTKGLKIIKRTFVFKVQVLTIAGFPNVHTSKLLRLAERKAEYVGLEEEIRIQISVIEGGMMYYKGP